MTRPHAESVPSGHVWLGNVPAHWALAPLGSHFDERSETVSDADFPPLSVTKSGVVPQMENVAKTDNNSSRKLIRAGDFAINSRSDRKGSSGLSDLDGSTSVVYTVLTPRPSIDGRFAHHLLRSQAFQEEFYRWGNGIVADLWSTRYSAMKRIALALPPGDEQRAIADYLDRETARIDTLIEQQHRLIEMLRERRAALLSAASDAPGPRIRLGRVLAGIKDGTHGTFQRTAFGDGKPLLGARNVMRSTVVIDGQESYITDQDAAGIVANGFPARGDVLLVIVGATIGKTAVYQWDLAHAFQRSVAFLRPGPDVMSRFLWYQIQSSRFQDELALRSKTSAQPGIYLGDVTSISIAVPSLAEQQRIIDFLDERTIKIDALLVETEHFIELLRERRAALITAAVTGQIDVRGVA